MPRKIFIEKSIQVYKVIKLNQSLFKWQIFKGQNNVSQSFKKNMINIFIMIDNIINVSPKSL